jgi:hypothetical protein
MLPLYCGPELNWKKGGQNLASCAGWPAWESQEQWEQSQWMSCNNRNICILSDSQACIKALGKYQITSKLVWNCHQSLIQVARESSTDMGAWSQGYCWWWNSRLLARTGSGHPFTGPAPACVVSQLELAKKWLGTGRTEIILNSGNPQLDSNRQRDSYQLWQGKAIMRGLEIEFLGLSASCVTVSSSCGASFSEMC